MAVRLCAVPRALTLASHGKSAKKIPHLAPGPGTRQGIIYGSPSSSSSQVVSSSPESFAIASSHGGDREESKGEAAIYVLGFLLHDHMALQCPQKRTGSLDAGTEKKREIG